MLAGEGGGGSFGLLSFWGTLVLAFSLIDEHSLIGTSISIVGLGLGLVFSLIDELLGWNKNWSGKVEFFYFGKLMARRQLLVVN